MASLVLPLQQLSSACQSSDEFSGEEAHLEGFRSVGLGSDAPIEHLFALDRPWSVYLWSIYLLPCLSERSDRSDVQSVLSLKEEEELPKG